MTRFTEEEMRRRFESGGLKYRDHEIKAKRDYADVLAYKQGFYIRDGYVVLKGGANVMPGAAWFETVDDAKESIDVLLTVGRERFWEAHAKIKEAKAAAVASVLEGMATETDAEPEASAPSGP